MRAVDEGSGKSQWYLIADACLFLCLTEGHALHPSVFVMMCLPGRLTHGQSRVID